MDSSHAAGPIPVEFDIRILLPEQPGGEIDAFLDVGETELGKLNLRQLILAMARDAEDPATLQYASAALRQIADQIDALHN